VAAKKDRTEAWRVPRWGQAVWGVSLLALTVAELAYAGVMFVALTSILGGQRAAAVDLIFGANDSHFFGFVALSGLLAVVSLLFLALSITHLFASDAVAEGRRVGWLLACVLGAHLGMLAYWFANVWHREPPTVPAEAR
jgi:hypothetical protein